MRVDPRKGRDATELSEMLSAWAEQAKQLRNGSITRDEYDNWRYHHPEYDQTSGYVKMPSQEFSNSMVNAFKHLLKDGSPSIVGA